MQGVCGNGVVCLGLHGELRCKVEASGRGNSAVESAVQRGGCVCVCERELWVDFESDGRGS